MIQYIVFKKNKNIKYFIQQECIKLIKIDSKEIYVTNDLYFK